MGELRRTLKEAQDGVAVPLDESTTIIVVPAVAQVTLKGRAFDAGRTFLLPRAVGALNEVFAFATRMQAKHAVVVDHVESTDEQPDALAEARAKVAAAWLSGDSGVWVDQYADSLAESLRWGARDLDKETDLFVVTDPGNDFHYRIYYRYPNAASAPDPSSGPITTETLSHVCTFDPNQAGTPLVRTETTTGTFLNLTALFEEEGFRGIGSQKSFRKNANWSNRLAMEWWHYEYTDHLQVGTLFGKVLLEMHSYHKARWCPPWSFYDTRFKRDDSGGGFSY